jgi:hypothetical protein
VVEVGVIPAVRGHLPGPALVEDGVVDGGGVQGDVVGTREIVAVLAPHAADVAGEEVVLDGVVPHDGGDRGWARVMFRNGLAVRKILIGVVVMKGCCVLLEMRLLMVSLVLSLMCWIHHG